MKSQHYVCQRESLKPASFLTNISLDMFWDQHKQKGVGVGMFAKNVENVKIRD